MRPGSLPWWQYFFYVNTGLGWVYGTAGLTGVFLIIILLIIVMFSLKVVRKKGFFEVAILLVYGDTYCSRFHYFHSCYYLYQVFYWTHNLFIPWYILLILHGTHFWKWFLVPALVYIIERIIRSKWVELARYGRFYIKAASNMPSKVVSCIDHISACFQLSLCLPSYYP